MLLSEVQHHRNQGDNPDANQKLADQTLYFHSIHSRFLMASTVFNHKQSPGNRSIAPVACYSKSHCLKNRGQLRLHAQKRANRARGGPSAGIRRTIASDCSCSGMFSGSSIEHDSRKGKSARWTESPNGATTRSGSRRTRQRPSAAACRRPPAGKAFPAQPPAGARREGRRRCRPGR